ncbi:MAG TPA: ATP synthase F0 subunit B [Pyrinomonadaceae bacterium]|nr:ATP synthase F0 subunit B [Pyrinomonadaceae bacterium]
MNLPIYWGYWLVFLVPFILWLVVSLLIRRGESWSAKFLAFIAGSDNRLSLSRLQAFAWTLVIFGSFFAAMAIHTKISPVTALQTKEFEANAKAAKENLPKFTEAKNSADKAFDEAEKAKKDAEKVYEDAKKARDEASKKIPPDPNLANLEKALTDAETIKNTKTNDFNNKDTAFNDAKKKLEGANAAIEAEKNLNWVQIPLMVLALAGIAIGSNIFSSLISALNSEEKSAKVNEVTRLDKANFAAKTKQADKPAPDSDNLLLIEGKDFGKDGKVRFGKGRLRVSFAPTFFWSDNLIVVDIPKDSYDTIVVDTSNGKLCYQFDNTVKDGETWKVELGKPKFSYEFADFFRDDKNPVNMDLMKFQMFGWTVIAICIYLWLFLININQDISSLPNVPDSIAILTGLSQVGYLAGKGASNLSPNKPSAT